jgi:hypothetical protein
MDAGSDGSPLPGSVSFDRLRVTRVELPPTFLPDPEVGHPKDGVAGMASHRPALPVAATHEGAVPIPLDDYLVEAEIVDAVTAGGDREPLLASAYLGTWSSCGESEILAQQILESREIFGLDGEHEAPVKLEDLRVLWHQR